MKPSSVSRVFFRPGGQVGGMAGAGVVHAEDGQAKVVDGGVHFHRRAVHDAVLAAVQNDAGDARQRLEGRGGDVVGMDLAVHAQRADIARDLGALGAAEVKDGDHVVGHRLLLLCVTVGILGLPAPGISAHLVERALCLPVEQSFCLAHLRVHRGRVARAARSDLVGDFGLWLTRSKALTMCQSRL